MQDDDFGYNYPQQLPTMDLPTIFKPKPNYSFHELFAYMLQFHKMGGKYPTLNDLDCFAGGEMVQPISLNIVSKRKIWHQTLQEFECSKLYNTMMDKNKSNGCNDHIFEEINPEQIQGPPGKNDILKYQVIFNLNQMPDSVT